MPPLFEQASSADRPAATGETSRTIAIGERTVAYVLRRARRRTIGLSIDQRGLRVGAPARATLREVEALLVEHGEWIEKKLDEWSARRAPELLQISDGVELPLLGQALRVRLASGASRCVWNLLTGQPTLTLCLRSPADAARLLERALRDKARTLFDERLAHYAAQLGVQPPRLSLSSARTRWGSCSPRSGIRLNWRLLHFPLAVVDYVVAHEVAHLREKNHSAAFWRHVERLCPDYKAQRVRLRELSGTVPRF